MECKVVKQVSLFMQYAFNNYIKQDGLQIGKDNKISNFSQM